MLECLQLKRPTILLVRTWSSWNVYTLLYKMVHLLWKAVCHFLKDLKYTPIITSISIISMDYFSTGVTKVNLLVFKQEYNRRFWNIMTPLLLAGEASWNVLAMWLIGMRWWEGMKMEVMPLSVVVFLSLFWVEERNASLPFDISCIDRWVLYH